MNITAEYNDQLIHLKWAMSPQDECQEIKTFIIKWNNIQKAEECNGQISVKVSVPGINVLVLQALYCFSLLCC